MKRSELLDELANRVTALELPHPVRVAIDGVDAAGKTTLADELATVLRGRGKDVIRASIDGFHNPASIRHRQGATSPEGYYRDSFNYTSLTELLLIPLGPNGTLRYRSSIFDYRTDSEVNSDFETATPHAVLLFDGVFLLRPELRAHWDFSIFVDAAFEITLARATERDAALFGSADEVQRRYRERYIPGQKIYLEECRPKQAATVIIDNNDPVNPILAGGLLGEVDNP